MAALRALESRVSPIDHRLGDVTSDVMQQEEKQ